MKKIIKLSLFFAAVAAGNFAQAVVIAGQPQQASSSPSAIHDEIAIAPIHKMKKASKPTEKFEGHEKIGTIARHPEEKDLSGAQFGSTEAPRNTRFEAQSPSQKLYRASLVLADKLKSAPKEKYAQMIENFLRRLLNRQADMAHAAAQATTAGSVRVQGLLSERTDGLPEGASPGIIDGTTLKETTIPKGSDMWPDYPISIMHGIDGGIGSQLGEPVDTLPIAMGPGPVEEAGSLDEKSVEEDSIRRPDDRGKFGGGHGPVVKHKK